MDKKGNFMNECFHFGLYYDEVEFFLRLGCMTEYVWKVDDGDSRKH